MFSDPKYEVIAATLRQEVIKPHSGPYLASERLLTARFGVDRSTIRRALQVLEEEGLILRRPGRRTEILPRMPFPSPAARPHVAFVANSSPRGWVTLPILHGAESELTPRGVDIGFYTTFSLDLQEAERRERERLEACLHRPVAGVLLWPATAYGNRDMLAQLAEAGIPVVLVDQQLPGLDLDFVGTDSFAAAYSVTTHLLEMGYRRVAHITRDNELPTTVQRIAGFRQAVRNRGQEVDDAAIYRCDPGQTEQEILDSLVTNEHRSASKEAAEPRLGFFGINDMTALRVLHHLARRRVAVPERFGVAGIDDLPVSDLSVIPLTTVHQPWEEIGAVAARVLLRRLVERNLLQPEAPVSSERTTATGNPEIQLLPTRLIVRASTGVAQAVAGVFASGISAAERL